MAIFDLMYGVVSDFFFGRYAGFPGWGFRPNYHFSDCFSVPAMAISIVTMNGY